jgi:hypothetical protein
MSTTSLVLATSSGVAILVGAATLTKYCIQVVRWFIRQSVANEISRQFVESMATNHLPHIYHAQQRICEKLGIVLDEPTPPIEFIKLEDR